MIWVTADPHFGHANIIEYCRRPFFLEEILALKTEINATTDTQRGIMLESQLRSIRKQAVDQMDNTIIGNYNRFVMPNDTLKIAGDFSMSRDYYLIEAYRDAINCKNVHLILGNHDYLNEFEYSKIFQKVTHRDIFKFEGKNVVVDHYSGRIWYNSHRGSWLLWGHSHGAVPDYGLSFDVGVDNWGFCPLSMRQISDIMLTKTQHHIIEEDREIVQGEKIDNTKGIHKGEF